MNVARPKLTVERLREVLSYDRDTGVFTWRVRLGRPNKVRVGDVAGSAHPDGYWYIRIDGRNYAAHRLAWFYEYGEWPPDGLDHKDTVRNHNWISNLRLANESQNGANRGAPANNTSGFKGVYWHKRRRKWRAQITMIGKLKCLGEFNAPEAAHAAYCAAAVDNFGEFARF